MKPSWIPAALLALAVSLAARAIPRSGSPDWPMFRGSPQLWGTSGAGLPERPELRWTYQAKESIESSAAIVAGVVYVGSQDGTLHAVDMATGKARWQYKTQGPVGESSPSVAGGTVYVGDLDGVFHAVDAATGAPRWTFKTDQEIKSSPNVAGDRILFGSYDGSLYCLSRSGKLHWKVRTEGPVHSTPAIDGRRTFVTGCDEVFRALDLETGRELFSVPLGAYTGASPAVRDDAVYVGTFANEVVCLDLGRRAVRWTYRHPVHAFPFFSSAAIASDRIVLGGRDKLVHCLDRATGKALWTFTTRSRVESSPLLDGGRVFVGSNDGRLYALDLASGKKVWEFTAGAPVSASPAAAAGSLVVGAQDGSLYCFAGR